MNIKEFQNQVENNYKKYFTDSKIVIRNNCLGVGFSISCYLIGNIDEAINKIIQNDMFNITFEITTAEDRAAGIPRLSSLENLPKSLIMNVWRKRYLTKPNNKYYGYGLKYLPFRKQTGEPEKLIKILDKYFAMLYMSLKKDISNNNIHNNFAEILNAKLIKNEQ